jgi:transcriptional regulator with XRE-family HTH domain
MFAKALNETLIQYRISASNLARVSGVKDTTISDFRAAKVDARASTIEAILEALPTEAKKFLLFKIINSEMTTEDIFLELNSITDRIKQSLEQSDSEIRFLKTIAKSEIDKIETKLSKPKAEIGKADRRSPKLKSTLDTDASSTDS